MKKRIKNKWLLLLFVLLPALSGCNDADDVQRIFTGKTWKLTYITKKDDHQPYDFWAGDAAAKKASLELVDKAGNYLITFSGATIDDIIKGDVRGTATSEFKGTWSANAKSQNFQAAVKGGNEKDILAKKFLEILNKADSYSGDEHNLYLYYENLSMVFHVPPTTN